MNNNKKRPARRRALSRDRVLGAAIKSADKDGIEGLSMRRLAARLKVEAMSLYHHFSSKEDILDGIVDAVFAEIAWAPDGGLTWKDAMIKRAEAMRTALKDHPWAIGLLDSRRNPGPATLRHHDAVLGCLLEAGFTHAMAAHAYALIDSFIYGFAVQENSIPVQSKQEIQEMAAEVMEAAGKQYPHLTEMTKHHFTRADYSFSEEFRYGLDVILEGLQRRGARS